MAERLDGLPSIVVRMLELANCPVAMPAPGVREELEGQEQFEDILLGLALVRYWKTKAYGPSRLQVNPGESGFDEAMMFSDIHRKYIRLRPLLFQKHPQGLDNDAIIETLGDLGVYAVMGIQIIELLKEAKQCES